VIGVIAGIETRASGLSPRQTAGPFSQSRPERAIPQTATSADDIIAFGLKGRFCQPRPQAWEETR
jgi:hypothetical protein